MFCKMVQISSFVIVLVMAFKMGYGEENKLQLDVYYESRCPDSELFIIKQLVPTLATFGDYVDVTFVPFGKSRSIKGENGTPRFKCQHGRLECTGNLVQGCVVDLMKGKTSDYSIAQYVACEMETEHGTTKDLSCAEKAGVNLGEVEHCISSDEGIRLQLEYELLTKRLSPSFIPSITVNGMFNKEIQDMALHNLPRALCTYLKDAPPCISYTG